MLLFYFLYHIRRVLARVSRPTHGYLPVCCPPLGSVNLSNSPSMSSLASLPSFRPQESSPESLPPAASSCRISRLPSLPSIPHAGPSRSAQRYLYFGVRQGFLSGVYTDWQEAEKQIAVSGARSWSVTKDTDLHFCIRTIQNLR